MKTPIFTAMNLDLGIELFTLYFISDLPENDEELGETLEFCGYSVIENHDDYINLMNDIHGHDVPDYFHPGNNIYSLETGKYCGALEDLVIAARYC